MLSKLKSQRKKQEFICAEKAPYIFCDLIGQFQSCAIIKNNATPAGYRRFIFPLKSYRACSAVKPGKVELNSTFPAPGSPLFSPILSFSPLPSRFFCPRPSFCALFLRHLGFLDDLPEKKRRLLAIYIVSPVIPDAGTECFH